MEAKEDNGAIAKHQTNEFFELLQPRDPLLDYKFVVEPHEEVYNEMLRFDLIPEANYDHLDDSISPFVYQYRTNTEVILQDDISNHSHPMVRLVWYNIMFTPIKLPTNYNKSIKNLKTDDLHVSLFRVLPKNVKTFNDERSKDLSEFGIWNLNYHDYDIFEDQLGGGPFSYFLHDPMPFHKIPKEAICIMCGKATVEQSTPREVEAIDPENIDHVEKVHAILKLHNQLIKTNEQDRDESKRNAKRLEDQGNYLKELHPKISELEVEWKKIWMDQCKNNIIFIVIFIVCIIVTLKV